MTKTAILGCGSLQRADGGVGVLVARELAPSVSSDIVVHEIGDDPLRMLNLWPEIHRAFVIDAIVTGARPGTIHRFTSPGCSFTTERFATSSRGVSVKEVIEMATTIGRLPAALTVLAIEGETFERGAVMTAEVKRAAARLVELLRSELTSA